MRQVHRRAAFLIVLMGLALEVAATPSPATAEEVKRLTEHDGVRIIRNLDPEVEFQQPLLSLHLQPSPKWPEKVEPQEDQRDAPEVQSKAPPRRTGSVACNVTDRLAGRCISNITVHRAGRKDESNIIVHRARRANNSNIIVH